MSDINVSVLQSQVEALADDVKQLKNLDRVVTRLEMTMSNFETMMAEHHELLKNVNANISTINQHQERQQYIVDAQQKRIDQLETEASKANVNIVESARNFVMKMLLPMGVAYATTKLL